MKIPFKTIVCYLTHEHQRKANTERNYILHLTTRSFERSMETNFDTTMATTEAIVCIRNEKQNNNLIG